MAHEEERFNITSAQFSLSADQSLRQRRYLISMAIRTLCFILVVVLPSPIRWLALLGAVTLPYFAVLFANAGRENVDQGESLVGKKYRELS